jgi:phosphoglycerate dehydrogenase-like enzyme
MTKSHIGIVGGLGHFLVDDIERALTHLGHIVIRSEDPGSLGPETRSGVQVDALISAPGFHCSREFMASLPYLRGVVSPVTGVEWIDVSAATDLCIVVANGQTHENTESLAEATFLLILAALYDLRGSEAVLRQSLVRPARVTARMLGKKTIGLIGYGQIARAMVARLVGWNVHILAHSRRAHTDAPPYVAWVGLDQLLSESDVVCVLASLNAETKGLVNTERLRLLKQGAVLVNTARGAIIDETGLYEFALQRPDIQLALDTFEKEPLPQDSPLRTLPNAILTPHMVGHTQESLAAIPTTAVENIRRILAGEPPLYVCNPEVLAHWRSRWANPSGRAEG